MGFLAAPRLFTIDQFREYVYANSVGAYDTVIVHHTAIPNESQWYGLSTLMGCINYYKSLGWTSCPHLFIAPEGIWQVCDLRYDVIGCSGHNYNTRQMETVGNYTDHLPSGNTLKNVIAATGILLQKPTPLGIDRIHQHRWYTQTSCPGDKWSANWEWFRQLVQSYMNTHPLAGGAQPEMGDENVDEEIRAALLADDDIIYIRDAALSKAAREAKLGKPLRTEREVVVDGKAYIAQEYMLGFVYCLKGDWGNVIVAAY